MNESRNREKKRRTLLAVLCLVFFALVIFSGWKVYSILHAYKTAERRYDSLSGTFSSAQETTQRQTPSDGEAPDAAQEDSAPPREVSPVSVDFEALGQYGGTVVGWLCLPDTVINYPVAQGDDNAFYLERFLDGSPIMGGTLFVDCSCPGDFSGMNTIIYGHNMKNGSMFALIDDYADQRFYEEHPVMYLNTPTQNYRVDVFSGFTTDPDSFAYTTAFATVDDYAAFLRAVFASSEIDCHTTVSPDERVLMLSTCTYSAADVRFVVFGKLTEIG